MPLLTSLTRSLLSTKRSRLSSLAAAADLRLTSTRSRLFPPFSGDPPRSAGPLFLSSPAYQLSQSATPLHCNADFGFLAAELRKSDFCRWKAAPEKHEEIRKELVGGEKVDGVAAAAPMEAFWNLPNLISLARLASGPLLGWMIVNEWYLASFFGLAISGISDWLDGFVARKMGINSVVGSYLDPLADKVLIGCVAIAMVEQDLLHPGLVLLVVTRDVGLVSAAVYRRACSLDWQWKSWSEFVNLNRFRPEKVEPLYISKVNTVLQLVLVAGALLQPVFGTEETQIYLTNLSWLVAASTVTSTVAYGVQHTRKGFVSSALGAKA